jgi:hypothetical protein
MRDTVSTASALESQNTARLMCADYTHGDVVPASVNERDMSHMPRIVLPPLAYERQATPAHTTSAIYDESGYGCGAGASPHIDS